MNPVPICIECAHFRNGYLGGRCFRKAELARDIVDGELRTTGARGARAERFIPFVDPVHEADRCGREGKHFTPKTPVEKRRPVRARWLRLWRSLTAFGTGDY